MHRLAAGHFAVEDSLHEIVAGMTRFYDANVAGKMTKQPTRQPEPR